MPTKLRVLVCTNPDLNYIDGSSIWAQTITLVLAETGLASVDFIAKSPIQRDELFGPLLNHPHITVIDGPSAQRNVDKAPPRLSLERMSALAVDLDENEDYDVVLVRGYEIAQNLLRAPHTLAKTWLYLTDIAQSLDAYGPAQREEISRIAHGCARLLCQTPSFRQLWHELVPDLPSDRSFVYRPVIPDISGPLDPIASRDKVAVYAGKFASEWMTLEMAETWPAFANLDATLRMIGDKIHASPEGFEPRMRNALQNTPNLEWLGAMSRDNVQSQLKLARVGLSWRADSLNDTLEYSTKILEYGGCGCAAILNRTPLHEELLGEDYPLFANTEDQYLAAVKAAMLDDELAQSAADKLTEVSRNHTFSARVKELGGWLKSVPTSASTISGQPGAKIKVLVAGHDLKFFTPLQKKLESTGQFEFLTDQWKGHNSHSEEKSRELLGQADVIFCEWCLGNLTWYSKNRLPHQRLVARFHLQEAKLDYLANADWENIDHISYVSQIIRDEGQSTFGFPDNRVSVIPNYLDSNKFVADRKVGDARFTLGMIGAAPARKRLDRAIDLLERLVEIDRRYCLRVKGRNPLDYPWILNRPDELEYYRELFSKINSNKLLSTRVIFDPPGDDVNEWFTMVGFILSPSDFESFHMAVGEGILAGSRPVIWTWPGAEEIWGPEYIVDSVEKAVEAISNSGSLAEVALPPHVDPDRVAAAWRRILRNKNSHYAKI